jgi:hypothetical protein
MPREETKEKKTKNNKATHYYRPSHSLKRPAETWNLLIGTAPFFTLMG